MIGGTLARITRPFQLGYFLRFYLVITWALATIVCSTPIAGAKNLFEALVSDSTGAEVDLAEFCFEVARKSDLLKKSERELSSLQAFQNCLNQIFIENEFRDPSEDKEDPASDAQQIGTWSPLRRNSPPKEVSLGDVQDIRAGLLGYMRSFKFIGGASQLNSDVKRLEARLQEYCVSYLISFGYFSSGTTKCLIYNHKQQRKLSKREQANYSMRPSRVRTETSVIEPAFELDFVYYFVPASQSLTEELAVLQPEPLQDVF